MTSKDSMFNWRFLLIILLIISSFIVIIFKIFSIHFQESGFLQNEGNKRYIKYKNISPIRGTIFDRNNFPLAVSIVNYDLYALKNFNKADLLRLSEYIDLESLLDKEFQRKTLLKSGISKEDINFIKKLSLKNLEIETRHSRHYPLGDQISTLIGFYGKDGAQEGLEKSYDRVLSGTSGRKKFFTNAKQQIISQPIEIKKAVEGSDIHLTIDSTIQYYAYKFLAEGIINNKAKAGTVVILDNEKGEVLALASYPSYNPNNPQRKIQKNRALVDAYELGSVLKPIVLSKAIDINILLPDSKIKIPRRLNLNEKVIVDTRIYEELSPKEIIAVSSQIGASLIALKLGYENLKDNYYDFGFTKPVSINFPSSAFGYMDIKENALDKEIASLGYGYGITMSPFQIASAYSVFANDGIYKAFKLLKNQDTFSRKIISSKSANFILDALEKVIRDGTGKSANLKGFSVGGKTGTVHQIKKGVGYAEDIYRASFIGITPLNKKSLTIFVSVDDPGLNAYSGGAVAAPIFANIAQSSLNHLGYFEDE